jgi:excisionase family DNA binding protein
MAGEPAQHTTITIPEIADRLDVCEETVYQMLKAHEIPNLRHGHRFIVSRAAYEKWEATIGTEKLPDVHRNLMPDCREIVRKDWPEREARLFARDELLNPEIAESN